MSDETDALVGLIDQENARVIHYQEERTSTTNIIFVVASAIIALISLDQKVCGIVDITLALILIPLGFLGMYLNTKYHERIHFHEQMQQDFYDELDRLLPNASINKVRAKVRNAAMKDSRFRRFFYKRTLWRTWVVVNAFTVLIGIILSIAAIRSTCP